MSLVGRILFALPLAAFGLLHFVGAQMMAGMVPAYVPGGIVWVYITGVGLILAAISIIANRFTVLSGVLLGIMLLSFVVTVHLPMLSNPEMSQTAMPSVLKDTALAGAAFLIAGLGLKEGKGLFAA